MDLPNIYNKLSRYGLVIDTSKVQCVLEKEDQIVTYLLTVRVIVRKNEGNPLFIIEPITKALW